MSSQHWAQIIAPGTAELCVCVCVFGKSRPARLVTVLKKNCVPIVLVCVCKPRLVCLRVYLCASLYFSVCVILSEYIWMPLSTGSVNVYYNVYIFLTCTCFIPVCVCVLCVHLLLCFSVLSHKSLWLGPDGWHACQWRCCCVVEVICVHRAL